MHKKVDVRWIWEKCPGCQEPMMSAPGPVADFMIKDEKDRPMFLIVRGWRCGFSVFGTVWMEDGRMIAPCHGHVFLTNILGRTIEKIS